jgi:amino acid adenylation domain-containing protein
MHVCVHTTNNERKTIESKQGSLKVSALDDKSLGGTMLISSFHSQVERTPDDSALSYVDDKGKTKEMTYRDLRAHVKRLSNAMSFLKPDQTVGIALHRSPACVVAIMAVLDAGACYVPLDPSYPKERLAIFVEDAKMSVLLAQKSTIEDLPSDALKKSNVQIFLLDESSSKDITFKNTSSSLSSTTKSSSPTKEEDDVEEEYENDDENLAYVIFTSGSTGRPKGVAMRRGALRNLIEWQIQELDVPPRGRPARTLQFAPISFDVHFQEIFGTLCAGGVVCLIDDDMRRDAIALLRHIESQKIERIFVPFVALQNLCEAATVVGFEAAQSLRDVVTAGEQLKCSRQLRKFFKNANQGKCRLHNHYGPSETHVVTAYTLRGEPNEWPDLPPIGAPIANCECYILDSKGKPVKEGEVGELFLGGVCLARGYLGREKITRERFVKDPFAKLESARMYKTGDLAKVIPETNGVLEFLGRIDSQVKIRGHRVELGEVESAINRHEGVGTEAVVVHTTGLGIKQLIAYIIPADVEENKDEVLRCLKRTETKLSREDIESHCKTTLPVYMRPARIYILNRFPLTPSGKVAKRNLPSPIELDKENEDQEESKESKEEDAPLTTNTEKKLAEIWTQVLGLRVRSSNASFVELGGQSLALVQLITRIFVTFQVQISFSQVSQAKSLSEMAQIIDSTSKFSKTTKLEIPDSSDSLPLSYNQRSLFHMSRVGHDDNDEDKKNGGSSKSNSSLNIPLVAKLVGLDVDIDSLRAALELLVRRHEALRTIYIEEEEEKEPYSKCTQDEKKPFNVLELDATGWSDTKLRDWMIETAETPFDLTEGPVIRIYLVWRDVSREDEDEEKIEQYLHLTVHHIAVDLWSLVVMMDELAILYKAAKGKSRFKRRKCMMAALEVSPRYVKYAVSQRRLLQSSEFRDETEKYWRQVFEDSVPVLSLPTDYPRPPRRSFQGAAFSFRIPNDVTTKLQQYCRSNRCTMFTVLMSAYQVLLARQSGQDDLVVGTPFACRHGMPGVSGSELERT